MYSAGLHLCSTTVRRPASLDWTYSFFIAAFFALADAQSNPPEKRQAAVVWARFRDAFTLKAQAPEAAAVYDAAASKSSWLADVCRADADNVYDGINAYLVQCNGEAATEHLGHQCVSPE